MKLKVWEDLDDKHFYQTNYHFILEHSDLHEVKIDSFSVLLEEECNKSNLISDKLLLLEHFARKVEQSIELLKIKKSMNEFDERWNDYKSPIENDSEE